MYPKREAKVLLDDDSEVKDEIARLHEVYGDRFEDYCTIIMEKTKLLEILKAEKPARSACK